MGRLGQVRCRSPTVTEPAWRRLSCAPDASGGEYGERRRWSPPRRRVSPVYRRGCVQARPAGWARGYGAWVSEAVFGGAGLGGEGGGPDRQPRSSGFLRRRGLCGVPSRAAVLRDLGAYGAAEALQIWRASCTSSALPLTAEPSEPSAPTVVSSRPIRVGNPSVPTWAISGQHAGPSPCSKRGAVRLSSSRRCRTSSAAPL